MENEWLNSTSWRWSWSHHLHCFSYFHSFLPFRHQGEISTNDYLTFAIGRIFYIFCVTTSNFRVFILKLKLISHSNISHSHHYSQKWFRRKNHYPFGFGKLISLKCRRRRFHLLSYSIAMIVAFGSRTVWENEKKNIWKTTIESM